MSQYFTIFGTNLIPPSHLQYQKKKRNEKRLKFDENNLLPIISLSVYTRARSANKLNHYQYYYMRYENLIEGSYICYFHTGSYYKR